MNYGLLADSRGRPVAVSVFEGNTADPKTLLPQVEKVRDSFGIASLVMVGDRGMISNVQIEAMRNLISFTSEDSFSDSITKKQAQFSEDSYGNAGSTVEVGSFPANTFGLHDMHGNVWEWCQD